MELNLTKPIAFFDLETTGLNIAKDRIVEFSVLKVTPEGEEIIKTSKINPTIPIPKEVSEIHGIYDKDVIDQPTFKQVAADLNQFLQNCDLAGYNALRFDIPLLVEEFLRAGVDFEMRNRRVVDVQNIFHRMEQRTLSAAYKFYCDKNLEDAHTAEADTIATYEVLKAQLDRYKETPLKDKKGNVFTPVVNDMKALSEFTARTKNADLTGQIIFNEKDEEVFNFGKFKGQRVVDVFNKEPQYYDWMMKSDFPLYTKKVIQELYFKSRPNPQGLIFK
ncbi:MAG: DNA polymerase III subunit epsilon [Marinilabiliales bacterium]|nr:MAG: DNA polymerase III subunit epsilon [Marinilabiliales bacterium]